MRLYRSHLEIDSPPRGAVVTLGNFDGVHRGHQRLMQIVRERAVARGGESIVFTFRPHPVKVLAPQLAPPLITTYGRKIELIAAAGIDVVVEEPFDNVLAALSPRTFAEEILARRIGAQEIVIGHDFTFGRDRAGNIGTLEALGRELGFTVHIEPAVSIDGLVASSTKVRELVLSGRVQGAGLLLGRPYALRGRVVRGRGRGRTIGVPTANIATRDELIPKVGVYACRIHIEDDAHDHRAVTNIGWAPTFEGKEFTIEAHVLDFATDIYDHIVTLELVERIRDEKRFPSKEALVEQIHHDMKTARDLLA
jgi:riboflavin kinase/FMN adenylyltransferase